MGYRIGLDIGITSVGWAVIEDSANGEPKRIIDLGSRIFDAAEMPKDGSPLAKVRRDARGTRRRLRRKQHRVLRVKRLLERYQIITQKEIENMYENYNFQFNVYELRKRGLDEKLTNKELARVLINFVKKRGYKSNSKAEESSNKENGKLLTATKENEELMNDKGYRSVAEMYLLDDKFKFKDIEGNYVLDKKGNKQIKIKNSTGDYKNTALRELIVNEIIAILNKQKELNSLVTDQFIDEYLKIFEGQRNFDDGPGEPSPYAGDLIEKMLGNCTFEKEEKRAPKATYTFEYFKFLQTLNHIKIEKTIIDENGNKTKEKRELTPDEREKIKKLIFSKNIIKYSDIRKELNLTNHERFNMLTYKSTIDFSDEATKEVESKVQLKEFESYKKIKTALNRIEKNYIEKLTPEELDYIGYALTIYKNDDKRINYLKENTNLDDNVINELLSLSFSKVGSLSIKAMKKIIPELEKGVTYDKAVDEVYEDFRNIINTTKKKKLRLADLESDVTNPVVRRGLSQSIKVLNAITNKYNKKYGKPDVVVVELAREMGKNFQDRNQIRKRQEENKSRNEHVKNKILELGKSNPTGQDIVKYKLWEEQDGICMYSGKKIAIENLFTEAVDVDHIIPYSACFDDSYNNKVLVLASENRQKGNRVPIKYMKDSGKNIEEYEVRVNNFIKNYKKKQKLLRSDFTREDAKDWKERNLNDTKYICKAMYNLIQKYLEFSDNPAFNRKVWTVNGSITAHVRKRLGIEKIRADGDKHHAVDAAVIATTTQKMINRITKYYQYEDGKFMNNKGEYIDLETGEILNAKEYEKENNIYFPEPWPKFRKELDIRTSCQTKERIIECLQAEKIYTYEDYNDVRPIFVSRMPKRKVKGAAHMETIKGLKESDGEIKTIIKKNLTELKFKKGDIEGYPESCKKDDKLLYNALKERLIAFNGDAQKAFASPFYKPKSDGTLGPLVKKVKIEEKTTLGVKLKNDKAFAANGDCVRIDIFYVEDEGYYFIPIYVSDTIKPELPTKACTRGKNYSEWKEMKDEDFMFSLYPKDLVKIYKESNIKLNPTSKEGDPIETKEIMAYYINAGISVASLTVQTHDNKYFQPSLGIKTLDSLEKYEVDVLGEYHKVKLPEKRRKFDIKK